MKQKSEDKILKKLIDEVIEKDRDIKERHEEEALKNATFETLTDMTELSVNEIKIIEKKIRENFKKQSKRKLVYILIISIIAAIILIILLSNLSSDGEPVDETIVDVFPEFKDKIVFTEDFNNNNNGWKLYNDFIFEQSIENGKYIFTTDEKNTCFQYEMKFKIPEQFTAEIITTSIKGDTEPYGIKIPLSTNIYSFEILQGNKARISSRNGSSTEWIDFPVSTEYGKNTIEQKITTKFDKNNYDSYYEIYPGLCKYYVNGKFIGEKNYAFPHYKQYFGIYVCGSQSVSFDHLKITNNRTGRVIIDNLFGKLNEELPTRFEFYVSSSIEDGSYIFKSDSRDSCYKTTTPYEFGKYAKVKLNSNWKSGETYYYGLILESDDNNYYAFELKSNGKACFTKCVNGVNVIVADDIKTGINQMKDKDIEQIFFINGKNIELYIQDKLILTETHTLKDLNYVGFRICGSQTIQFDKLEIRE